MIVSIFKKNYFLQLILLFIVPLLLWIPAFINSPQVLDKGVFDMPLYDVVRSIFPSQNAINSIIAFILVILHGFLINYLCTFYQLSQKTSFFPAFIYILLMSSDYRFMTLSSILLANTFIILAVFTFLKCYNKKEGLDEIYLSTVLLSTGTLFYSPTILLMLWIWIGLFNFKIYKLRSFLVSMFGFITPLVVLFVYYYLNNNTEAITNFANTHFGILPSFKFLNQPIQIVYVAYLFILTLPAFVITLGYRNDQKLSVRKRISTILLLFAISILPFLYDLSSPTMTLIFAPALSYILSVFFFSIKRNIYSDTYIIILLILTIVKIFIN